MKRKLESLKTLTPHDTTAVSGGGADAPSIHIVDGNGGLANVIVVNQNLPWAI